MAQFFINRPIFAWVIAFLIMLGGLISIKFLPISSYPNIAPPQVKVNAVYPGASAKTIEDTVTTVIEDEMNGIEGLRYIASESSRSGTATITLTFATGTNIDLAGVEVQNRLKRVEARLPSAVTQQGVNIDKTRPDFLMILALYSPQSTFNETDLADYVDANILGEIRRVDGVGTADLFGAKYAMRIWLDPKKMTSFRITPAEIINAIQAQNAQLATGELGALPSPDGQQFNATVIVPSRLATIEEFGNIILRSDSMGAAVNLSDVARIERGAENYNSRVLLNGQPATAFWTKLSNTGNALATAESIKSKMDELSEFFPEDMLWMSPYDTSLFVEISIEEVFHTLIEAVILVTIVMFVFLQNWRTTLIPLIVVPFSLVGTGIAMSLFGFSINMLTMFGMVLAIGIVVDDAILVVENVMRLMQDEKLKPYAATKKAMKQISGAIIGTTAVLISVFLPMAFMGGAVGQIYKQFSLTIITSVFLSSIFALSLTPAMSQGLLKAEDFKSNNIFAKWIALIIKPLKMLGNLFNRLFTKFTNLYMSLVKLLLTLPGVIAILLAFGAICFVTYFLYYELPKGFVPSEDQGYVIAGSLLPAGATQERTKALTDRTDAWLKQQPEVKDVITVLGFGFVGTGQNTSITFANLYPWDERTAKGQRDADSLIIDANKAFQSMMNDGLLFSFNSPPIPGLGNDNGFDFRLQDRTGSGNMDLLNQAMGILLSKASETDILTGVKPNSLPAAPQLQIDVDRIKARSLGIDINNLNSTLQIALGSAYVNDYIDGGKVRQVWVQADAQTRSTASAIMDLEVRNDQGNLVKLNEIANSKWLQGPAKLNRYNGVASIPISGSRSVGISSGAAIDKMEEIAKEFPKGIGYSWSGQSLEEKISGGQAKYVFGLSFLVVFLVLAALYESWAVPIAVMLVVPLGILGSVLYVSMQKLTNDVYFTVGIITIIGLSTKNAIMIVEFARELQNEGKSTYDAVIEACRLRFRPILMTAFAFILGVLPLVLSTGAGSASRVAIGTAVFGGMITATVLAIFFVPVFYLVIRKVFPVSKSKEELVKEGHDL